VAKIDFDCPECLSTLHLDASVAGKAVRCPVCQEVIKVPGRETAPIEPSAPVAKPRPAPPRLDVGSQPVIDQPKVVAWSDAAPIPERQVIPAPATNPAPKSSPSTPVIQWNSGNSSSQINLSSKGDDDFPYIPPKSNTRKFVVVGLLLGIIGLGIFGGYRTLLYVQESSNRLYASAQKSYEEKKTGQAIKAFEQFIAENPTDPRLAEANFYLEISRVRESVYSVANITDPSSSTEKMDGFLKSIESPEMKPFIAPERFGRDVWETLQKLAEDIVSKSKTTFNADTPEESERWLGKLDPLIDKMIRFRPKAVEPETVLSQQQEVLSKVAQAKARLMALQELASLLESPTPQQYEAARQKAQAAGLSSDPKAMALFTKADSQFREQIRFVANPKPLPQVAPQEDKVSTLIFTPRIDPAGKVNVKVESNRPSPPFFAISHGLLHALDANDGSLKWALRIGIDSDLTPILIPGRPGQPERILLSVDDQKSGRLELREAHTGKRLWTHSLERFSIGAPVVFNQRIFLATREPSTVPAGAPVEVGRIEVISLETGDLEGSLITGRPLATGGSLQVQRSRIAFVAQSRQVILIDAGTLQPDGRFSVPKLAQVIETNHPADSVVDPLLIVGNEGESAVTVLLLPIRESLTQSILQAWRIEGEAAKLSRQISFDGWIQTPWQTDGEKLLIATDRGERQLLGLQLNAESNMIFPILKWSVGNDARQPVRGGAILQSDRTFWSMAGPMLSFEELGFTTREGFKRQPRGIAQSLGNLLQEPVLDPQTGNLLLVTQEPNSGQIQASCVQSGGNEILWQRQLGLPGCLALIPSTSETILIDRTAGIHRLPNVSGMPAESSWQATDTTLVSPGLTRLEATPKLLQLQQDDYLLVASERSNRGSILQTIRINASGISAAKRTILPSAWLGSAAIQGERLIVPLQNGSLVRVAFNENRPLESGPLWTDKPGFGRSCSIQSIDSERIMVTEASQISVWKWAIDQTFFEVVQRIPLFEPLASPPLLQSMPTGHRFWLAEANGNVRWFDLQQPQQPLKIWQLGPQPVLDPLINSKDVLAIINQSEVIRLNADLAEPMFRFGQSDQPILGIHQTPSELFITLKKGVVKIIDAATGAIKEEIALPATAIPSSPIQPLNAKQLFAPLEDGTVVVLDRVKS
jgi:hypothetical protein